MKQIDPIVSEYDLTPEELANLTFENLEKVRDFFESVKVDGGVVINIAKVYLPEFGVVTDYRSVIVSRFHSSTKDTWFVLADGYAVNVSDMLRRIEDLI
jgi:hypothetical protein